MKKTLVYLLMLLVLFSGTSWAYDDMDYESIEVETGYAKGQVIKIIHEEMDIDLGAGMLSNSQTLEVKITSGPFKGQIITTDNMTSNNIVYDIWLQEGDKVLLYLEMLEGELINGYVADYVRDTYIFVLIGIFIIALILIGRFQGLKSVLTLGITLLAIGKVMLPLLFKGLDPVWVALITGIIIASITLLIIGGATKKTAAAILGTAGGLLAAALIAIIIGKLANLRGLSGEEAQMLLYIPQNIDFDFRGLLFAGIMIGALGAVMDVCISIASAMEEISSVGNRLSFRNLFNSGMNVGKDIMGTMSNTLILAYTGTSIPLLLLIMAYDQPLLKLINMDFLATEFVRALSGSIGLVLAVPITALIAGYLMKQNSSQ